MSDNFIFIGFEPEADLKLFAKELLWKIEDMAPSQSARYAKLEKIEGSFRGEIKLSSADGIFEADSIDLNALKAIEKAYDIICVKLNTWKTERTGF